MLGMARQEMFDKMVNHLRNQKIVSRNNSNDICLYRGPDGLKCAVGALIPDELYDPKMEEHGIDYLFRRHPELYIDNGDVDFLISMQSAHDSDLFDGMEYFERKIKDIAKEYNLTYTEPKES